MVHLRSVMSDNGPQFSNKEFKEFKNKIRIYPYQIKSNVSKVERHTRKSCLAIKQLWKKAEKSGEDPYVAI